MALGQNKREQGYDMLKEKLLDFLVIGATKCGTTALFQYLRNHPEIYMPPEKEVGFFSNEEC